MEVDSSGRRIVQCPRHCRFVNLASPSSKSMPLPRWLVVTQTTEMAPATPLRLVMRKHEEDGHYHHEAGEDDCHLKNIHCSSPSDEISPAYPQIALPR